MKIFNRNITKADTSKKNLNSNYWLNLTPLFNNDVVLSIQTYYDLYAKNGDIRECVKKISWSVARNGLYLLDNQKQIVPDNVVTSEVQNLFKEPTFPKFKVNFWRNYLISWEVRTNISKIQSKFLEKLFDFMRSIYWTNQKFDVRSNQISCCRFKKCDKGCWMMSN